MKSLSSSIMESIGSSRFGAEKKKKKIKNASDVILFIFVPWLWLFCC